MPTRMRTTLRLFTYDIDNLSDLAMLPGNPPNATKSLDWNWNDSELLYVTTARTKADAFWKRINNKRNCPLVVKDEYKRLIKDFMAYDHGKVNPHNLLDKISDFGTLQDCETVKVKRGTPLAKTPSKGGNPKIKLVPVIGLIRNEEGKHVLTVTCPDTPTSRAAPKGLKAMVYCYIGEKPAEKLSDYSELGIAEYGYFVNNFEDINLPTDVILWAWYYALYVKVTTGKKGLPAIFLKWKRCLNQN